MDNLHFDGLRNMRANPGSDGISVTRDVSLAQEVGPSIAKKIMDTFFLLNDALEASYKNTVW
jgi:hypothetical protein